MAVACSDNGLIIFLAELNYLSVEIFNIIN